MPRKSSPIVLAVAVAGLFVVFSGWLFAVSSGAAQAHTEQSVTRQQAAHTSLNKKEKSAVVPGVVLIGVNPGVTLRTDTFGIESNSSTLQATLTQLGVRNAKPVFPQLGNRLVTAGSDNVPLDHIYRLNVPKDADVRGLADLLETDPAIQYAEPDYIAHLIATPNDPLYSGQWGLDKIDAPAAWDTVTGTSDVSIAVIDSGVDSDHPDLSGQLWINPGEIAGNGTDDDNNGHIDDINGWNFVGDDHDLSDTTGHGTEVAGVMAATTDNGQGGAGVCWNCRLMILKVTQSGGIANFSDIATAVAYAAQKGADVINLSLGGYSDSATLRAAIETAADTAVIVGGTGNDDTDNPFYPAAYDDHVLAVAGTTISDTKVASSNYGTWVDVSAPGESITTTFSGGSYGATSGTSMAAPFASGLAGLLLSQHTDWSPAATRAHIVQTTSDIDALNPGLEGRLGSGRISASTAANVAAQPLLVYQSHMVDGETNRRPQPGSTVDLDVTLFNDWGDASNVQATLSSTDSNITIVDDTTSYSDVDALTSRTSTTPFRVNIGNGTPFSYDIPFTLNVTAASGYSASVPFTVTTAPNTVYVHGTLTTQTWTNDRVYIIDNDVGIPAGETLTIEPGTEVQFDGKYTLNIAGTLIADGTADNKIHFSSNTSSPLQDNLGQIKFLDSSTDAIVDSDGLYVSGSIVRHTNISYSYAIYLDSAAPFIAHNDFSNIVGAGIGGNGSSGLVVTDNHFKGSAFDSTFTGIELHISGGNYSIVRNTISDAMFGISAYGPGLISGNTVRDVRNLGIRTQGQVTVTANRVMDSGEGIFADDGKIIGNLLTNNEQYGLRVGGTADVMSNTLVSNRKAGIYIESGTPITPTVNRNNLIVGAGQYAIHNTTSNDIDATNNWWGTNDSSVIEDIIYDGNDEFGIGFVDYASFTSEPEPTAPAYVQNLTISPDTTLGIQTATFEVEFSRQMDQSTHPSATFYRTRRDTWSVYNSSNSGLPTDNLRVLAIDEAGTKWIGTWHEGVAALSEEGDWRTYTPTNSGLAGETVAAIAFDEQGNKWFGTMNGGVSVLHQDGSWETYNSSNSGLAHNYVSAIAFDQQGNTWFGTHDGNGGVSVLRPNGTWQTYNTSNSGLGYDDVPAIVVDSDGNKWFGTTGGGLSVLRTDGTWHTYNTSNSPLPSDRITAIAIDNDGTLWLGTGKGFASFNGERWAVYAGATYTGFGEYHSVAVDRNNGKWLGADSLVYIDDVSRIVYSSGTSELPQGTAVSIAVDNSNSKWIAVNGGGVAVLYGGKVHKIVDNMQWLDPRTWQATCDITTLLPRDTYTVSISAAIGSDDIEISTDARYTFIVDYAGEISDDTPPSVPWVAAASKTDDPSAIVALWSATDSETSISSYRYAIGSARGSTDIVNWTPTTNTSLDRTGLKLVEGRQYWFMVQAQNSGGLWSESGFSSFVAGEPFPKIYLPLTIRSK